MLSEKEILYCCFVVFLFSNCQIIFLYHYLRNKLCVVLRKLLEICQPQQILRNRWTHLSSGTDTQFKAYVKYKNNNNYIVGDDDDYDDNDNGKIYAGIKNYYDNTDKLPQEFTFRWHILIII